MINRTHHSVLAGDRMGTMSGHIQTGLTTALKQIPLTWDEYKLLPIETTTAELRPNRDAPNRCYPHIYVKIFVWVNGKQFRYTDIIYKGISEVSGVIKFGAKHFLNLPSNNELIGKPLQDVIDEHTFYIWIRQHMNNYNYLPKTTNSVIR